MSSDPRKWVRACTVHNQLVHKRIHLIFFLHRGRRAVFSGVACTTHAARQLLSMHSHITVQFTATDSRQGGGTWGARFSVFAASQGILGTLRRRTTVDAPAGAARARPLAPPRSRRRTAVRSSGGARRGVVGACRSLRPRCTAVRRTVVGTVNRLQLIYYSCTEIPMTVLTSLPHGTSHMYTV